MALGTGAISMRDVFYELYGRYPNVGETYTLKQLFDATTLGVPHQLLRFRNYSHYPAYGTYSHSECGSHTGYNGYDYYHDGQGGYYSQPNGFMCPDDGGGLQPI